MKNRTNWFAYGLNEVIISRDLSRIELANLLGVSQATISDWLSGRKFPRTERLEDIFYRLGLNIHAVWQSGFGEDLTYRDRCLKALMVLNGAEDGRPLQFPKSWIKLVRLELPNQPGVMYRIARTIEKQNINIEAGSEAKAYKQSAIAILYLRGTSESLEKFERGNAMKYLRKGSEKHFNTILQKAEKFVTLLRGQADGGSLRDISEEQYVLPDRPGSFAKLLSSYWNARVNIIAFTVRGEGGTAVVDLLYRRIQGNESLKRMDPSSWRLGDPTIETKIIKEGKTKN